MVIKFLRLASIALIAVLLTSTSHAVASEQGTKATTYNKKDFGRHGRSAMARKYILKS